MHDPGRPLRLLLRLAGVVPLAAAAQTVLTGARTIPGGGPVPASVDSELRYYSAWYAGAGVAAWRAAGAPEEHGPTVRLLAAAFLLGALGRVVSLRQAGRPHPTFLALLGVEVVVGTSLLALQREVERA